MIVQSPESGMPEPYKTYVRQRSESIAHELGNVVGNTDVQLCPRAITPDEYFFKDSKSALVYGAIVTTVDQGYKSVLYPSFYSDSIATRNLEDALVYGERLLEQGNRVRVKDPTESDGQGQQTVETLDELGDAFYVLGGGSDSGVVLMPHLETITCRASIGYINLGRAGMYFYLGREQTTQQGGHQVYGGTELGLFRGPRVLEYKLFRKIEEKLDVPRFLRCIGRNAISDYFGYGSTLSGDVVATTPPRRVGRVSFDAVMGITDNGTPFADVIDITPRVGGTTPAEILAIQALSKQKNGICYAKSQLFYEPQYAPSTGTRFVDTDTLVISAQIEEVTK